MQQENIESKTASFLQKEHLLSLAVCCDSGAYAASLFYAFDPAKKILLFSSDLETLHMRCALKNRSVAGTVAVNALKVLSIKGVQFRGCLKLSNPLTAKRLYVKRFPFASKRDLTLWSIEIAFTKYTDNSMGFGKKILWESKTPPICR